ncbi:MAG: amidohydrolase family protein, partial [Pseudomonadota bacterium]
EKAKTYPLSPSGTPGVQTLLPVMLHHVNAGRLTIEKLVELMCYGPQRIHGLVGKGRIAHGYDADITVVDMAKVDTITQAQQKSRAGWTPFEGMAIRGWPVMTIINGEMAMREGQLQGVKAGKMLRFHESHNA